MDQIFGRNLSRRWHFVAQLILFLAAQSFAKIDVVTLFVIASMLLLVMRLNDLKWAKWIAYPLPSIITFAVLLRVFDVITVASLASFGSKLMGLHYAMILLVGLWPRKAEDEMLRKLPATDEGRIARVVTN